MHLMPLGSKIYHEIRKKKKRMIVCQFAWTLAVEPANMEGLKSQKTSLLIIIHNEMFVQQLLSDS